MVVIKRNQCFWARWHASVLVSPNLGVEPESAHDGDQSRRPWHPKWGDISIPLPLDCLFFQYSCISRWLSRDLKLPSWTASMVCRWNLGTRPPIRISDIPSWTYDKNTYSENPARSEGPWIKSNTDFAIINKLSGWKWWCNEANWSPGVLRCFFLESWLYYKVEHNRSILRDAFGDMLEHMAYFGNRMDDHKI